MPHKPAKVGDEVFQHLNTRTVNEIYRMLDEKKKPQRPLPRIVGSEIVLPAVTTADSTAQGWHEGVAVINSKIKPAYDDSPAFKNIYLEVSNNWSVMTEDNWGVALTPTGISTNTKVQLIGCVWMKFTQVRSVHRRVTVNLVDEVFESSDAGKASIIVPSSGGTAGYGLVCLEAEESPTLYRFTLNADLVSGTADADIIEMDGTDTTWDRNVLDPLGIFSTLEAGDPGLCIKQNGKFYVIQAPCPIP